MKNTRPAVIGIDIGGVLISRANDKSDTSFFGPNFLLSTAVGDAFESVRKIVEAGYTAYLVSKCGEEVERKTRQWLRHHKFYEITGLPEKNVRFCRTRQEKAGICNQIKATHFVDDRLEVLSYLESVPNLFLFDGNPKEIRKFAHALPAVTRVNAWTDLADLLTKSKDINIAS